MNGGCTGGINIIGNDIGVNDYATATTYPINLGTTNGMYIVEGNQINLSQTPGSYVIGSNSQGSFGPLGTIFERGNTLQNTNGGVFGICCQTPGFQSGELHDGVAQYAHAISPVRTSSMDEISFALYKGGFASPSKIFRSNSGLGGTGTDDWAIQNVAGRPNQTSSLIVKHTQGATGNLFVGIDGSLSGLSVAQIAAPDTPGVQNIGGTGTTTYSYAVVAYTAGGGTVAGPAGSTATGVSSLSGSQYNQMLFYGTAGALQYCIWRTTGGGTSGSIGCIPAIAFANNASGYSVNAAVGGGLQYWFKDTGLAGDGKALPTLNTTGQLVATGASVNGNFAVAGGTVTLPITGTGPQCLHVSATGVVSGTGADCGNGGGSGSGTVNSGSASQVALYAADGTTVSGDSSLTDDGTTLIYAGTGGISAATAAFSGNVTVNGQLMVAGPWLVSSVPPSSAMTAAASGYSAIGVSNDGNFYISANGGDPAQIATTASPTLTSPTLTGTTTVTGALSGTSANFSGNVTVGGQIIGTGPWAVSGPVPGMVITPSAGTSQAAFDTNGLLTVSENGGASVQVAKINSNISGTAANLSGTPALPNGTSATTQGAGDNSAKLATTAYVDAINVSPALDWGKGFTTAGGQTVPFNTTTSHANVFGIYVDQAVKCSGITVYVALADNSATTYDIGLYNGVAGSSNNLVAHTGAVAGSTYFGTASSYVTVPFGSTVTLTPGRYYLALYANAAGAPLTLAGNTAADWEFYHLNGVSITPASGGLPATLTGPADAITSSATPHFLLK